MDRSSHLVASKVSDAVRDAALLAKALHGVATSESMPHWPEYRERVEDMRGSFRHTNPEASRLLEALVGATARRPPRGARSENARADLLFLPWSNPGSRQVSPTRLCAALASFTDDYEGHFPQEFFPGRRAAALVSTFSQSAPGSITIVEQWIRALGVEPEPLAALVILHATIRQLARGRDCRALTELSDLTLCDRLALGAAIAPFSESESRGGDPLGDTYHYWAMVLAGFFGELVGSFCGYSLHALFRAAPHLMSTIRGGVFRRVLFYGAHASIDRMGLLHGCSLARALS